MEKVILEEIRKLVEERNELRRQLGEARELIRRRNDGMDKYDLDYPECPYCGADAPDERVFDMSEGETREIVCLECGKKYTMRVVFDISYDCIGKEKSE
jgi:DNA-directed RNA polymerase subunit RPC12/RpoP